jgi:hypothetical protein
MGWLTPGIVGLIVAALVFGGIEAARVSVLVLTGNDDAGLSAAANTLLAVLVTAIAAERAVSHARHNGHDK